MQTSLAAFKHIQDERQELASIVRSCVHCGFCNAVCPTYQLLGNELDGPRGRIYLIKEALEGAPLTTLTQLHLDRCLTCRSCETVCPSGVRYGQLLDAGRFYMEHEVGRSRKDKLIRFLVINTFSYRRRFAWLLTLARLLKPWLPNTLANRIPRDTQESSISQQRRQTRTMIMLPGCVQPALAPTIDAAAIRVLDQLGISLLTVTEGACCGALPHHLSAQERALTFARKNIDACKPYLEEGAEAIVYSASACGLMAKDYGRLLRNDPVYAADSALFSRKVRDLSEILAQENLSNLEVKRRKIAFHSPCTLQHGQRLGGLIEKLLKESGFELTSVVDSHLCCGSAGVYSFQQPYLSEQLLVGRIQALEAESPELIATANIGCLYHLQSRSRCRVLHWIELFL